VLRLTLFLQWGETLSSWNWASNGPFIHPPDDIWVNMEQRWNDNGRGKTEEFGENLSQCHFFHHESHMDSLGANPGLWGEKPVSNRLSYGTAPLNKAFFSYVMPSFKCWNWSKPVGLVFTFFNRFFHFITCTNSLTFFQILVFTQRFRNYLFQFWGVM
jgi:hypothetical protein